jgi:homocysteine S-methyltransferase
MTLVGDIAKFGCLLLDGGLATTLEDDGHLLDKKLWSAEKMLSNPKSIQTVHEKFIESGSNIITTASYQMSYEGYRERGCADLECENLFHESTACAIRAREQFPGLNHPVMIAASIGCYGAHLADGSEYQGTYGLSSSELLNWHQKKFSILQASGADLLAFETIPCLTEAHAIRNLISQECQSEEKLNQGWISFACRSGRELNSGEMFEDAVRLFTDSSDTRGLNPLWGIGINCTNPIFIPELLDTLRDTGAMSGYRPIVVYPNRGETWDATGRIWIESSGCPDESFGQLARGWKESGANIIGGCCRTTPATIREVARALSLTESK